MKDQLPSRGRPPERRRPRPVLAALLTAVLTLTGLAFLAPPATASGDGISGMVTAESGAPLAGICVNTYRRIDGEVFGESLQATTAADGSYTVPVGVGEYKLWFWDCTSNPARAA